MAHLQHKIKILYRPVVIAYLGTQQTAVVVPEEAEVKAERKK